MNENIKALYESHKLGLDSVNNARDLGGYVCAGGKHIRKGMLLRTAQLNELNEEEAAMLAQKWHVTDIVDFRTTEERENFGLDHEVPGTQKHWIHVMDDLGDMSLGYIDGMKFDSNTDIVEGLILYIKLKGGIRDLYDALGRNEISWNGYRAFFDVLLKSEGSVLWHCSMGKDRAGFAAVLLLSALGADKETILDDYEASNVCYEEFVSQVSYILDTKGADSALREEGIALAGVSRSAMVWLMDMIDSEFGGMHAFLRNQIGLTDEQLTKLRSKYLV